MSVSDFFHGIAEAFDSDGMKIFTGVAAIIALILEVVQFSISLRENRKNITIKFDCISVSHYTLTYKGKHAQVVKIGYSFANYSQLPIAFTRIRLFAKERYFDSEPRPYVVEHFSNKINGVTFNQDIIKTTILPIRLEALGAQAGYLAFLIPKGILSGNEKALTFQICTNRGKIIEKTLSLHEEYRFY